MAQFDPNLIAALTLRKAVARADRFEEAYAKAVRAAQRTAKALMPRHSKTRAEYRSQLPPLTPEELARIGRLDGLTD